MLLIEVLIHIVCNVSYFMNNSIFDVKKYNIYSFDLLNLIK